MDTGFYFMSILGVSNMVGSVSFFALSGAGRAGVDLSRGACGPFD